MGGPGSGRKKGGAPKGSKGAARQYALKEMREKGVSGVQKRTGFQMNKGSNKKLVKAYLKSKKK